MPSRNVVGHSLALAALIAVSIPAMLVVTKGVLADAPHAPIRIVGDAEFTAANGVTDGTGTAADPYVIEGWDIVVPTTADGIRIESTTAAFVVRNVFVHGNSATPYAGIHLAGTQGGRIENATVTEAARGVHFEAVFNATLANSTLTGNFIHGVEIESSDRVLIRGNAFDGNRWEGIYIWSSRDVTIETNTMTSDGVLIYDRCPGAIPSCRGHFASHSIAPDNTVNALPLRFLKDCSDVTLDGVPTGQLIAVNCTRLRVANLRIAHGDVGIEVAYSEQVIIEGSTIQSNRRYGIFAYASANLSLVRNGIRGNGAGPAPGSATAFDGFGIFADRVTNVNLSSNFVEGSLHGARLWNSGPGIVVGNNVTANLGIGLHLDNASGLRVHHNAFAGNRDNDAVDGGTGNVWDDGYPSGGNYWWNYGGRDCCGGPAQTTCDSPDRIGDTPYAIPPSSLDRFPLVLQAGPNTPPQPGIVPVPPVRVGEQVILDATSSSDREDPSAVLEARWDYEGDGVWDTNWSSTKITTHTYLETGRYRVILEVRDRACSVSRLEVLVQISPGPSPPPDAAIVAYAALGLTIAAVILVLFFLRKTEGGRGMR